MAKKQASTNKNTRRRQKINVIFNATSDLKLANKYRDLSWETIQRDFGVLKPEGKTIPTKKEAPKNIDEYFKATREYREHLNNVNLLGNYKIPNQYTSKSKRNRQEIWSVFSSKDEATDKYKMPETLDNLAAKINLSQGLDPNSSYGYAAVYYSFTEDIDVAEVLKNMNIINKELDVYSYEKKVS
jgi:hypothetical protein